MTLNPHKFKELKVQESMMVAKLQTAQGELYSATKSVDYYTKKLEYIRQQLANGSDEPVVSEHALLRAIERKLNINLDEVKKEILTDTVKEQIKIIGNGKIPQGEYTLIIKNNVVVSIVPQQGRKKQFNEKEQADILESYHKTKMNITQVANLYRTSPTTVNKIIERKY